MNYQKRRKPEFKSEETNENIVTGRNPVMEVLKSGRTVDKILVAKGEREGSILKIVAMAKEKGITVIMSLHEIDLAEKISDRVVCVKGDRIYRYGAPDDIFREDVIKELYELDNGFFDPLFGSIELAATKSDAPEVFVISGDGLGIPVYRKLQRKNLTFAAGILYENDMDYRLARLLAQEVVTEKPFTDISDESFERAEALIKECGKVIYVPFETGACNERIKELVKLAEDEGKLEIIEPR
jgi:iron complex transport system ATP-binding protein